MNEAVENESHTARRKHSDEEQDQCGAKEDLWNVRLSNLIIDIYKLRGSVEIPFCYEDKNWY